MVEVKKMKLRLTRKTAIIGIVFLIFAILPVFISSSYIINLLVLALLYGMLASAWNFVSGYAGQFGLGNGLYFALGAYICAGFYYNHSISPWLGMFLSALVVSVIALLIGFVTFPLSGSYYALSTIALLNILKIIFTENQTIFGEYYGGVAGLRINYVGGFWNMQFIDKRIYYYIVLVMLVITIFISYKISTSKPGFYFKAINTNQMVASSLGVNVLKYKQLAQFLTAFIMSVGGGFYAMYMSYVEPISMFSNDNVMNIMLMAVVGGRATIFGPVIASLILMPLYEILRLTLGNVLPGLPTALFGISLVVVMQFMPEGIVPRFQTIMKKWAHKKEVENKKAEGGNK